MTADSSSLDHERRLAQIESTLPHLVTKADLHALEARLTRWIAGIGFGVVGTLIIVVGTSIAVLVDRFSG